MDSFEIASSKIILDFINRKTCNLENQQPSKNYQPGRKFEVIEACFNLNLDRVRPFHGRQPGDSGAREK